MKIPSKGGTPEEILAKMKAAGANDARWRDGRVFSLVYYAGEEALALLKDAYMMYFSENGLNPSVFPSLRRFEAEVVAMTAHLLGGDAEVTGTMTAGGTESILMAVKTAKTFAQETRPEIKAPEMVVPLSAHPAFDKAAHYFGVKMIHTPLKDDLTADVEVIKRALTPNTILMVGSAPAYPQGVMDPIAELSTLAREKNIWLHVDACVGGFMLPFVKKLGYPVPPFDFSTPGVSSMSADIHKYGYAAKGASVVLYRTRALRKRQFFVYTEWPGGIYASPSVAGTRPGGAIAAAWAALNYFGEEGYLEITKETMETTRRLQEGINAIDGLKVLGAPVGTVFGIGADTLDIYAVGDEMTLRGWVLDRQQNPASLHLTVNRVHTPIVETFLTDLREAVRLTREATFRNVTNKMVKSVAKSAVKILPKNLTGKLTSLAASGSGPATDGPPQRTAALYGMIGSLPNRGDIHNLVLDFMDKLNAPPTDSQSDK